MSFKSIFRELKGMKDGIGNLSRRGIDKKNWRSRTRSHVAPDQATAIESPDQGCWANIPPELLLDIIRRVESSETSWPDRKDVVSCASVCKSWREVTMEIVQTPEQCGRLTFPISLKQPGPRDVPIQCFIKRDRATSTFRLFFGLTPSENESDKLMLAAKRIRRATTTDFIISLVTDDFSRASNTYVGKLRSNFLGTKFDIYDSQPPANAAVKPSSQSSRRFSSKQVSPRLSACNYSIATISYELNVLRTRGPRRLNCTMDYVPISAIQEGGSAPTLISLPNSTDGGVSSPLPGSKEKGPMISSSSTSLKRTPRWKRAIGVEEQGSKEKGPMISPSSTSLEEPLDAEEPLVLKNKAPRWHEQLQCWCLNFRGRVTVASVKNFQLVAAVEPQHNIPEAEQERVILQFGKIGKDIFTMDYCYPLSAFQAFAICLSSFDTKPTCE